MPHTEEQTTEPRDSLRHLLDGHTLAHTIEDTVIQVRKNPAQVSLRWMLFQLLCLEGEWERALTQLQIWASLDTRHLREAQMLRELLRAESYRAEVMEGRKQPGWLDQPPRWASLLIQAAEAMRAEDPRQTDMLRTQALDLAPDEPGHANPGPTFGWISDSDSRLGPMCELMFSGGYRWIPFSRIASLSFPPVTAALDLVWRPCSVTLRDLTVLNTYPTGTPGVGYRVKYVRASGREGLEPRLRVVAVSFVRCDGRQAVGQQVLQGRIDVAAASLNPSQCAEDDLVGGSFGHIAVCAKTQCQRDNAGIVRGGEDQYAGSGVSTTPRAGLSADGAWIRTIRLRIPCFGKARDWFRKGGRGGA
ncbi:type VI secretion system accessory protein TagJ [Achromobacter sp.]|uniref:type VI secretion system accessory protein TagJ n=1 Tax=Achromobacter sp. TaxID=134375 RepID=UPI003C708F92